MRRVHVGLGLLLCAVVLFAVDQLMPMTCSSTPTSAECNQGLQPPVAWIIIPIMALAGIWLLVLRPRPASPPGQS